MDVIQNLSEYNQKRLLEDIIENRRKIGLFNKINLMEACFRQNSFDSSAELWYESILKTTKEIDHLYTLTEQVMKGLNKDQKRELKTALLLHSINNLNSIIYIKKNCINCKN
jgi:uncharacterized membrane protein